MDYRPIAVSSMAVAFIAGLHVGDMILMDLCYGLQTGRMLRLYHVTDVDNAFVVPLLITKDLLLNRPHSCRPR